MPEVKDSKGKAVKVGDVVTVRAKVEAIKDDASDGSANAELRLVAPDGVDAGPLGGLPAIATHTALAEVYKEPVSSVDPADLELPEDLSGPIAGVLKFFEYKHLPSHLQDISRPFRSLAVVTALSSSNPETTVRALQLLEAKDAAVRAVLST